MESSADDIGPVCFDEDLFSGTRTRVRAINTDGYIAKQDDPLWFQRDPGPQRSAEEKRKTLKVKLDYLYYQRDYAGVVELSAQMISQETLKDNSLRKELLETNARALIHLKRIPEAAALLDQHHEDFLSSGDLEQIWCSLRGTCAIEMGHDAQAATHYWRLASLSVEHVPCWMKLVEILLRRPPDDSLASDLALLCIIRLKASLARIASLPGRKPAGGRAWPTTYSSSVPAFVEASLAELAKRGAKEREGMAQNWCERARQSGWNAEELLMIGKCLLSGDADTAPAEDINPVGL